MCVCIRGLSSEDSPKIQKVDPSCHGQAMTCCGLVGNKGMHLRGIQYIGLYRDYVGILLPSSLLATSKMKRLLKSRVLLVGCQGLGRGLS